MVPSSRSTVRPSVRGDGTGRWRRTVALVTGVLTAAGAAFAVQAPAAQASPAHHDRTVYVALGDSYASGEANPPFDTEAADCHRSPQAWPQLLGARLRWQTVNLACSGATTAALISPYKGQPAQVEQLAALDPDVVSVTIGGNDAGFGPVIGLCLLDDCKEKGALAAAQTYIATVLPGKLSASYKAVRAAAPGADLVVVGYPRIVPRSKDAVTGCPWLSEGERIGLNRTADLLNLVLRIQAYRAGAVFVDVGNSLRGHELCTADSWVYPLGLDANVSYWAHPTAPGQAAIAASVRRTVRWLAFM